MRLVLFVEPVVFRDDPLFLAPHLDWCEQFVQALPGSEPVLVSGPALVAAWRARRPGREDGLDVEIDGYELLAYHGRRRVDYLRALYGGGDAQHPLARALGALRERQAPGLAVLCSQNAIATAALAGMPQLHIEQAPLPRVGHPARLALDPCGHQTRAAPQRLREAILSAPCDTATRDRLLGLRNRIRLQAAQARLQDRAAVDALQSLRRAEPGRPIALLALQPRDWVTHEGALGARWSTDELLLHWADQLPPGWLGVPTSHPDAPVPQALLQALARHHPQLRSLPDGLGLGTTEALLTRADALVTVSSSSAATALLFGVRCAVVGASPWTGWVATAPWQLAAQRPLDDAQAVALLRFLTHRYSVRLDALGSALRGTPLLGHQAQAIDGLLDAAAYDVEAAERLFALPDPVP